MRLGRRAAGLALAAVVFYVGVQQILSWVGRRSERMHLWMTLLAFALSFSSTVCVIKILEDGG